METRFSPPSDYSSRISASFETKCAYSRSSCIYPVSLFLLIRKYKEQELHVQYTVHSISIYAHKRNSEPSECKACRGGGV